MEWLGLTVGFGGVAMLAFGRELRAEPWSAALVMVAPISWALGSQLSRKLPLPKGLMSAATQMLTAGVGLAVLSLVFGEQLPASVPLHALAAWAYLAVFGSLVAYSAYTYLLRNTRPALATSYSYVNPAIAVVIGLVFGHEYVGPEAWLAVALIVGATLVVVRGRTQ